LGEVSVSQQHLQSFLKTASLLRIRGLAEDAEQERVGNKKPTKKNHLKNPLKRGLFVFFLILIFFMKIIQTFLFETDFL
jgi:hypothetical protein